MGQGQQSQRKINNPKEGLKDGSQEGRNKYKHPPGPATKSLWRWQPWSRRAEHGNGTETAWDREEVASQADGRTLLFTS